MLTSCWKNEAFTNNLPRRIIEPESCKTTNLEILQLNYQFLDAVFLFKKSYHYFPRFFPVFLMCAIEMNQFIFTTVNF